jgi:hypothetical protein
MRYALFLLLSLALFSSTGTARAQIQKNVSKISGAERWVSKSMHPLVTRNYPGHGSFRAEYVDHPENGSVWRLSFFGFAKDTTKMATTTDVRMQVDGETIAPLRVTSKVRPLDDSILEVKEATFSRADFRKIATAADVTGFIGKARFEFTRPLRKDLRLILDRVPNDEGPQTASTVESDSTQ